jgi:predicted metalloprotease with PDZ domain
MKVIKVGNNPARRPAAFLLAVIVFLLANGTVTNVLAQPKITSAGSTPRDIAYTVSMSKPWTHLLEVEMRVKASSFGEKTDLVMPVWTPGSYLIREYARHVQDFAAKNSSGNPLMWQKTNKNTWQINSTGLNEIVVSYRVYANELTVRTNELNDQHAFWNNAATLMYPDGQLKTASTLKVVPYGNWKIATGLPPAAGQANTFRAENFDILYDSPFDVSNFKEMSFEVRGVPHRMIMDGDGNYDLEQLRQDIPKIVAVAADIFGEIPYKDYTFIVNLRGGGGLEHLNSTALQFNRFGFKPSARYMGFLGLVAHEFFHAWNVKRLRPDALGPFDYTKENYTKLLWMAEGGTDYYGNVLLLRAGLMSDKDFLAAMASEIESLQGQPGRFQTSVEEASWDAWIKYYRQDENAINNQISYYEKGSLVVGLLDIEIRKASGGAKSMDDVLRFLYTDFFKKGRNYTPEDLQKIAETMAGKSLDDFFRKYVRGRDEIDYNSIFNGIGLQLDSASTAATAKAYLGVETSQQGERLMVTRVASDTPAYEQGLNTGDQIVAIDGVRASQASLQTAVADKKPGDKIKLMIFRFDETRTIEITLGRKVPDDYSISPLGDASDMQKQLYQGWVKANSPK